MVWLTLLWLGAPLLDAGGAAGGTAGGAAGPLADRVRNAVLLGVAIPYALGFAHALYGLLCLALAALCAFAAWRTERLRGSGDAGAAGSDGAVASAGSSGGAHAWSAPWLVIALAAVALAAWPQLVRPPLDGDTLAYHLPNALAWVRAHSLWTTGTRYWWYPGGSELFAAGLISIGARWSVPLSGAVAAALVTLRLTAWGWRSHGTPSRSALPALVAPALIAAAFLAVPASAVQAGTMQNDLWLAAAMLEVLWVLLHTASSRATIGAVALCSLVKPTGVAIVLIAVLSYFVVRTVATRGQRVLTERAIDVLGGLLAFALWVARDVLLAPSAIIPIRASLVTDPWRTTIAGAGGAGLRALGGALLSAGVPTLVFAVAPWGAAIALAAVAIVRLRTGVRRSEGTSVSVACVAIAGMLASLLYFALPFGFSGSVPQLGAGIGGAGGGSLRFDLPAMACGAALLVVFSARLPVLAAVLGGIAALAGLLDVQRLFWNDALTHTTVPAVALGVLLLLVATHRRRVSLAWSAAAYAYALAAVILAGAFAGGRAVAFYDASMRAPVSQTPTGVFAMLVQLRPRAVVALDVRAGAIGMLLPQAAVYDDLDDDPCGEARRLDALLIDGTDPDVPIALHERRRAMALRRCGRVVYADAAAVIAAPSAWPSRTP